MLESGQWYEIKLFKWSWSTFECINLFQLLLEVTLITLEEEIITSEIEMKVVLVLFGTLNELVSNSNEVNHKRYLKFWAMPPRLLLDKFLRIPGIYKYYSNLS